jgi:hypothetical protein
MEMSSGKDERKKQRTANMCLPQAGLDKLSSSFYHYCALAMGLDLSVDSIFDEMMFMFIN